MWLPPVVLLVNLAVVSLLMEYSSLNVRPDLPASATVGAQVFYHVVIASALVLGLPTMASVIFL
jgi:hypothetical protein